MLPSVHPSILDPSILDPSILDTSIHIDSFSYISLFRMRDYYHTCYCLSGLSVAQHFTEWDKQHETVVGIEDNLLVSWWGTSLFCSNKNTNDISSKFISIDTDTDISIVILESNASNFQHRHGHRFGSRQAFQEVRSPLSWLTFEESDTFSPKTWHRRSITTKGSRGIHIWYRLRPNNFLRLTG